MMCSFNYQDFSENLTDIKWNIREVRRLLALLPIYPHNLSSNNIDTVSPSQGPCLNSFEMRTNVQSFLHHFERVEEGINLIHAPHIKATMDITQKRINEISLENVAIKKSNLILQRRVSSIFSTLGDHMTNQINLENQLEEYKNKLKDLRRDHKSINKLLDEKMLLIDTMKKQLSKAAVMNQIHPTSSSSSSSSIPISGHSLTSSNIQLTSNSTYHQQGHSNNKKSDLINGITSHKVSHEPTSHITTNTNTTTTTATATATAQSSHILPLPIPSPTCRSTISSSHQPHITTTTTTATTSTSTTTIPKSKLDKLKRLSYQELLNKLQIVDISSSSPVITATTATAVATTVPPSTSTPSQIISPSTITQTTVTAEVHVPTPTPTPTTTATTTVSPVAGSVGGSGGGEKNNNKLPSLYQSSLVSLSPSPSISQPLTQSQSLSTCISAASSSSVIVNGVSLIQHGVTDASSQSQSRVINLDNDTDDNDEEEEVEGDEHNGSINQKNAKNAKKNTTTVNTTNSSSSNTKNHDDVNHMLNTDIPLTSSNTHVNERKRKRHDTENKEMVTIENGSLLVHGPFLGDNILYPPEIAKLLGVKFYKKFGKMGIFQGFAYLFNDPYYTVVYEDNDREELTYEELVICIQKSPQVVKQYYMHNKS